MKSVLVSRGYLLGLGNEETMVMWFPESREAQSALADMRVHLSSSYVQMLPCLCIDM